MQKKQGCPCCINDQKKYYCRVLHAVRNEDEEEICSICPVYGKNLLEMGQGVRPEVLWKSEEERISAGIDPLFPDICSDQNQIKAFRFAASAHHNQFRKGTQIPYLIHLIRTWSYVKQMTGDSASLEAALLHDVLEDTAVTKSELTRVFGEVVCELVTGESEKKRNEMPAGESWQIRKRETIERLKAQVKQKNSLAALRIAFADKLANLYSMAFEYRQIGDALWQKFNQTDKSKHAWYYGSMKKVFYDFFSEREPNLVKEYEKYYQEVFGTNEI